MWSKTNILLRLGEGLTFTYRTTLGGETAALCLQPYKKHDLRGTNNEKHTFEIVSECLQI